MHLLYRLRDALALTRPELTALWTISALIGLGAVAQRLPAPPTVLAPDVITYSAQFHEASAAPSSTATAPADDALATRPGSEEDPQPSAMRTAPRTVQATPATPVALNTATAAQLETLPRIGPKMAARILDYRAQRGGFRRIDDLQNVRGIGSKTLERLRPLVTLD